MSVIEAETQMTGVRPWDAWSKYLLLFLVGFCLTGRSFSYLGIPPAKLFIGDLTLAAFILLRPRELFDRWFLALTRGGPLAPFSWVLLISIAYGVFETVRGVLAGFSPLIAFQNLVFNIYPMFFFLGLWVGARRPDLMRRLIQIYAWGLCIYGPLYFLFLHKITVTMPGSDSVSVFGQPGGGAFVILGLLCFESRLGRYWLPITVSAMIFLAGQVRSDWFGAALSFMTWGVLERKMKPVIMFFLGLGTLLLIGAVLDVNIPSPASRGGAISTREIMARGLSAVDPQMAKDITGSEETGMYAGTISWRENWWHAIWVNSQESPTNFIIGPGYGFLLRNLVSYLKLMDLRTPHNIFYFALGYSGWVGVCIFMSLQTCCFMLLWRVYRVTGQAFGLASWSATLFAAFFGNVLETPSGAIPLYLIIGLLVAPSLSVAVHPLRQTTPSLDNEHQDYAAMNGFEEVYARD